MHRNFHYLSERWPDFQEALRTLQLGHLSYYVNPELAVVSALLTFAHPEAHAGLQRMEFKRAKARAAGVTPSLASGASIGEEFVALERELDAAEIDESWLVSQEQVEPLDFIVEYGDI